MDFYVAVRYGFLYFFKGFGAFGAHPVKHLCLTCAKDEVVVFLNEAEGVCKGAESLSYGFSFRPQPAKVEVSVSYAGVVHGVDLVNALVYVFMHRAVFVI